MTSEAKARIVRTPDIYHGAPRIDGTRNTTATIYYFWMIRGVELVQETFPHLTIEQIEAAVAYETSWHRRFMRFIDLRFWKPEFEGTIRWRGREWEIGR